MVLGISGGKYWLAHATKETLDQVFIGFVCGQEILPMIIGAWVVAQNLTVGNGAAFQYFIKQAEMFYQCVDGPQHGPSDIIGVDLIAGQQ